MNEISTRFSRVLEGSKVRIETRLGSSVTGAMWSVGRTQDREDELLSARSTPAQAGRPEKQDLERGQATTLVK